MKKFRTIVAATAIATVSAGLAVLGPVAAPAADASSAICPNGSLNFGVEPYEDAKTLIPIYQNLTKTLESKLGCKVNLEIADSYVAEILAMKNGKLDFAEFGPAGFVFASQQAGAIPVASFADKNGRPSTYTAGIWVPKSSSITNLKGLAGHTLALSSVGSTSGDWVPRYALMQAGVMKTPTDTSTVHWTYAGGHPESLAALTNGHVDAAEINSQEEATAIQAGQFQPSQYREIWKSSPIFNDPLAMSPKLSATQKSAVKKAILGLTAKDLTSGGKDSIADELVFTPPKGKPAMIPVTKKTYANIFALAKKLGLTAKDL